MNTSDGDGTALLAFSADMGVPFTPHENGQFTNPNNRFDVSGDGRVAPIDALLAINELNTHGARLLLGPHKDPPYFDVSDDEYVTALDVLLVINRLNAALNAAVSGEREASSLPGEAWEHTDLPAQSSRHTPCAGIGTRSVPSTFGIDSSDAREAKCRDPWVTGQSSVTGQGALAAGLATLVQHQDLILRTDQALDVELDDAWDLGLLDLDLEPLVAEIVGAGD